MKTKVVFIFHNLVGSISMKLNKIPMCLLDKALKEATVSILLKVRNGQLFINYKQIFSIEIFDRKVLAGCCFLNDCISKN